ncbi:MAG: hypothetical protein ACKO03_08535 [Bacteroidota bacterium]
MRTLFFIASLSLLLSCKKNESPATIDVKVGALLSLTGNWSTLGKTSDEAIRLALVNTNDYMATTSSPYRFSLVTYDTKLDTSSAIAAIAATVNAFPDANVSFEKAKNSFYFEASKYFGITGPLLLNTAGDRTTGSYDYWGIAFENGAYKWKLVGKSG